MLSRSSAANIRWIIFVRIAHCVMFYSTMFEQYFLGKINDSLISLEFKVTFGVSQSFSVIENREKSLSPCLRISIYLRRIAVDLSFRFGYDLGHMDTVVFSAQ